MYMSTSPGADISKAFSCRLVFILTFVLILFVICISTKDSARLSIFANLSSITCLYYYANIFIRVCISKPGCASIGTNLYINALVFVRVFVFI